MATISSMRVGAASRVVVSGRVKTVKVAARGSWRESSTATVQASRASSATNRVSPTRSVLPANWRQELESLRNGNGSSSAASSAPAPARSSSASWRDAAPASSAPARSSSDSNKAVTPSRSALPSNWKQELESLRSNSPAPASSAPAPARSSSASWRDAPASSSSSSADKAGTNPWTGKSKPEIKRTALPADWRKGL